MVSLNISMFPPDFHTALRLLALEQGGEKREKTSTWFEHHSSQQRIMQGAVRKVTSIPARLA